MCALPLYLVLINIMPLYVCSCNRDLAGLFHIYSISATTFAVHWVKDMPVTYVIYSSISVFKKAQHFDLVHYIASDLSVRCSSGTVALSVAVLFHTRNFSPNSINSPRIRAVFDCHNGTLWLSVLRDCHFKLSFYLYIDSIMLLSECRV